MSFSQPTLITGASSGQKVGAVRAWARRIIIADAVRLMAPVPWESERSCVEDDAHEGSTIFVETNIVTRHPSGKEKGPAMSMSSKARPDALRPVVSCLLTFDRIVFILSVLEGICDRECAALLRCDAADVVDACVLALQAIASEELLNRRQIA